MAAISRYLTKNQRRQIKSQISQYTRKTILLSVLIIALFCFVTPAFASEKIIGVIMSGDIKYFKEIHNAFMSKLEKEGYANKVKIFMQKPYTEPISMSNAARKLIAMQADMIVTYGSPAAIAAFREKTNIPIVYAGVYDPIARDMKAKNITGISSRISVLSLLRYLRGIAPLKTLGVIYSTNEISSVYQMEELSKYSEQYNFVIEKMNLTRPHDAPKLLAGKKLDAIFITNSSISSMAFSSIIEYAKNQRVPTASLFPDEASQIIISYYADPVEQGVIAAEKVIKILGGTQPSQIMKSYSDNIELIFNLKDARALGISVPMDIITEATSIIK